MTPAERAALRKEHDGPNDCGAYIEFLEAEVIKARGAVVHCKDCRFFQGQDCQHENAPVMYPRLNFGCVLGEKRV